MLLERCEYTPLRIIWFALITGIGSTRVTRGFYELLKNIGFTNLPWLPNTAIKTCTSLKTRHWSGVILSVTTSRDIFNKKKAKTEGALYKDLFMPTLSLRWYVVMLYLPSKKITKTKTETMCKNCERKISNCYGMEWKSNQASPNVQNKSILGLILEHTILLLLNTLRLLYLSAHRKNQPQCAAKS